MKNVFEVQQEIIDILVVAEKEMIHHGKRQKLVCFWRASELKKVEQSLKNMTQRIVAVVHSGKIAKNSAALENVLAAVDDMKKTNQLPQMPRRPRLTPHFSDRE